MVEVVRVQILFFFSEDSGLNTMNKYICLSVKLFYIRSEVQQVSQFQQAYSYVKKYKTLISDSF